MPYHNIMIILMSALFEHVICIRVHYTRALKANCTVITELIRSQKAMNDVVYSLFV